MFPTMFDGCIIEHEKPFKIIPTCDLEKGLESLCLLSNETVTVDLSRSKSFSRKSKNLKRVADVFPVLSIQGTCIFDSRDFTHLPQLIRKLCPSIWSVYWNHERSWSFRVIERIRKSWFRWWSHEIVYASIWFLILFGCLQSSTREITIVYFRSN